MLNFLASSYVYFFTNNPDSATVVNNISFYLSYIRMIRGKLKGGKRKAFFGTPKQGMLVGFHV